MVKNFVSVSGVSCRDELDRIHDLSRMIGVRTPVVIGYQVSHKSIHQGTRNPRQPFVSELGDLDQATRDYGFTTAIHYFTRDNNTILPDLVRVSDSGIDLSQALVQFNTSPPSRAVLDHVKGMRYTSLFKVAVSNKQNADGGYAVWKGDSVEDVRSGRLDPLVFQALDRCDLLGYVMFDPSHGTGLDLDLGRDSLAVRFGKSVVSIPYFDNVGLVYAGGITSENVGSVASRLNDLFPGRFSVDVESGVRTDNELDLHKVRDYLLNFEAAFQR